MTGYDWGAGKSNNAVETANRRNGMNESFVPGGAPIAYARSLAWHLAYKCERRLARPSKSLDIQLKTEAAFLRELANGARRQRRLSKGDKLLAESCESAAALLLSTAETVRRERASAPETCS